MSSGFLADARGGEKTEKDRAMTPDAPSNQGARMLTDAERKAEQKASKKAGKKAARDKANRERQMGARRRK